MATKCKKCGGLIPDVIYGGLSRNDCKNHNKIKEVEKGMTIIWKQTAVLIIGAVMTTWLLKTGVDVLAMFMASWTLLLLEWNRRDDIKDGKCDE